MHAKTYKYITKILTNEHNAHASDGNMQRAACLKSAMDAIDRDHESAAPDLSVCTSDELWLELRDRFTKGVLVFEADAMEGGTHIHGIRYKGSTTDVLGLLRWANINYDEAIRSVLRPDEELG